MKQISIFDVAEQERIAEKVQAYKPMADILQEAKPCALCGIRPVIYRKQIERQQYTGVRCPVCGYTCGSFSSTGYIDHWNTLQEDRKAGRI